VAAYEQVLRERGGMAAFLVWGDPSLYDSTIRIVEQLAGRLPIEWDVLPGISAPQLLAARHRIVLHPVGLPVHVTAARRLREAIAAGQANLVVMLGGGLDLGGLEEWSIWWGANLGTAAEELVAGRVGDVLGELRRARARAKVAAGWVMDVYLLRAPGCGSTGGAA
jgi:precorrin-6A synthase